MGTSRPQQVTVANAKNLRKVLIMVHDAGIRETIRVLLGSLEYQCVFAADERQALALLDQENPSMAILDQQSESFSRLILRLQGRVVVIADASRRPIPADRIGLWRNPQIQWDRLVHELGSSLEALSWPRAAPQRITRVAQLIFDSFRQPLPAGVRISPQAERRLFYECGAITIDLSFERGIDPPLIRLVGQILDSVNPDAHLEGIPVVLQGRNGPIALATTNGFGEFHVEFGVENTVTVELEIKKNRWVTLVSPNLESATETTGASE
jgi:hypothetical protein